MEISSLGGGQATQGGSSSVEDPLREINVNDFLKMLIAELQNQDPLSPTDNAAIIEQVSQVRSIQSTTQLTESLNSVVLAQKLSSASGMINKRVTGIDSKGNEVNGVVSRVGVESGTPNLIIGNQVLPLENVREIQ